MVFHFHQLYDHLLIVLEAAEMPAARADLAANCQLIWAACAPA